MKRIESSCEVVALFCLHGIPAGAGLHCGATAPPKGLQEEEGLFGKRALGEVVEKV